MGKENNINVKRNFEAIFYRSTPCIVDLFRSTQDLFLFCSELDIKQMVMKVAEYKTENLFLFRQFLFKKISTNGKNNKALKGYNAVKF